MKEITKEEAKLLNTITHILATDWEHGLVRWDENFSYPQLLIEKLHKAFEWDFNGKAMYLDFSNNS